MIALQRKDGKWFSEYKLGNSAQKFGMVPSFVEVKQDEPAQIGIFATVEETATVVESLTKAGHQVTVRSVLSVPNIDGVITAKSKIVPVVPDAEGRIVAPGVVRAVFDTNGNGVLYPVAYRQNPMDGIEVKLVYNPAGQVYVQIEEF